MAMRVSKYKPDVPVIALTPSKVAFHRMALLGYVYPLFFEFKSTVDETLAEAEKLIEGKGYLAKGDTVIVATGHIDKIPGLTNTIKLYNFGELSK